MRCCGENPGLQSLYDIFVLDIRIHGWVWPMCCRGQLQSANVCDLALSHNSRLGKTGNEEKFRQSCPWQSCHIRSNAAKTEGFAI